MSSSSSSDKKLRVKAVPVSLGARHPPSPHNVLPTHEFTMGIIAPKGSGKTTLMINLLAYYAKYFHAIYIFSPTVKNDEKWDWVKEQDLVLENKPLAKWFRTFTADKGDNPVVDEPSGGDALAALAGLVDQNILAGGKVRDKADRFDGRIPAANFMYEYDEADLARILAGQQHLIDFLHEQGVTKHLAHRTLFIFDDLVGSTLFSNARGNVFKRFNTNHRHLSNSVMMVSQAYKEIPKTVRTNFSALVIFEIFSDAEIANIHDEFPMGLRKEQWEAMYAYAVTGEHSFLYYNMQKPQTQRIMKNFDQVLFFKEAGPAVAAGPLTPAGPGTLAAPKHPPKPARQSGARRRIRRH